MPCPVAGLSKHGSPGSTYPAAWAWVTEWNRTVAARTSSMPSPWACAAPAETAATSSATGSAQRTALRVRRGTSDAFRDGVDLIGDEPVGVAVHGVRGLGGRGVDEAEDLAGALVDPVAKVLDVVVALGGQIGLVGLGDVVDADPAFHVVDVHEQCHVVLLG